MLYYYSFISNSLRLALFTFEDLERYLCNGDYIYYLLYIYIHFYYDYVFIS